MPAISFQRHRYQPSIIGMLWLSPNTATNTSATGRNRSEHFGATQPLQATVLHRYQAEMLRMAATLLRQFPNTEMRARSARNGKQLYTRCLSSPRANSELLPTVAAVAMAHNNHRVAPGVPRTTLIRKRHHDGDLLPPRLRLAPCS